MNIIAAVIGEFLRKRPIVCLYLFPQNVKRRFVYNPDENPCHACGPVRVPTASDATLRSSRGNRSSGHRSYLCSGIRPFTVHPPHAVGIKSISSTAEARRFNPNGEPPKALQIIHVILSIRPCTRRGTASASLTACAHLYALGTTSNQVCS